MYGALPVILSGVDVSRNLYFGRPSDASIWKGCIDGHIYIRWHNKGVFEFMNRDRNKIIRYTVSFYSSEELRCFLFLGWNICAGSVPYHCRIFLKSVGGTGNRGHCGKHPVEIRMPRALTAAILGGALALSGYLLQTFFP